MASTRERRIEFPCVRCNSDTDGVGGTQRAEAQLCRECFGKGPDRRPRELNDLSGAEWARASRSVEQYPDTRSEKQRNHGACFPESLARQQIEIYTKSGDLVFDPFVGVGTTLDACVALGRRGIGIDINAEFVDTARADLLQRGDLATQQLIIGDARSLTDHVEPESVDFVLTSPPYGPLLKQSKGSFAYKWKEHSRIDSIANPQPYSDAPDDIGNLEYPDFLDAVSDVMTGTLKVMKHNTYAVWVVKDFRAIKAGVPYVNLHGHLIERAESSGFTLWDLRIYDQTKFRPLVCLGFPSRNFYLNIGHSYLVVLKKQ